MDMEQSELIFKSDGMPFQTEKAAVIQQTRLRNEKNTRTKVVAVEGGFALKQIYQKQPKRVPMGRRNVLTYPKTPGYVNRVFNYDPEKDMGQRIKDAEEAGWEIVTSKQGEFGEESLNKPHKLGSAVSRPVGGKKTGILMRKREDWYEEDMAVKQKEVDEKERALQEAAGVDGKYGKVKIGNRPH